MWMAFEKLQFVAISTLIHSSPSLRLCCIMIAKNERKNFSYAMLMQRKNIIFPSMLLLCIHPTPVSTKQWQMHWGKLQRLQIFHSTDSTSTRDRRLIHMQIFSSITVTTSPEMLSTSKHLSRFSAFFMSTSKTTVDFVESCKVKQNIFREESLSRTQTFFLWVFL